MINKRPPLKRDPNLEALNRRGGCITQGSTLASKKCTLFISNGNIRTLNPKH